MYYPFRQRNPYLRRSYLRRYNPYSQRHNPYSRHWRWRCRRNPWERDLSAWLARSHMMREAGPPPYWEETSPPKSKRRKRAKIQRSTKPKVSHYERKRRERFRSHGLRPELDIKYAGVQLVDKVKYGEDKCTLCDANISERYKLFFRKPTEEDQLYRILAVSFFPVGNVCITNWAEELPDSEDKRVFLEMADYQKIKGRNWEPPPPPPPPEIKEPSSRLSQLLEELDDSTIDDW